MSTTQLLNLNLRTQVSKSGVLSSISFFSESVFFRTSESELGSGGSEGVRRGGAGGGAKTKQIPGWRQGLGVGIFKTVSGGSSAGSG